MSKPQPWSWIVLLCMLASLTLCFLYVTSDQTQWDITARELQGLDGTSNEVGGTKTPRVNDTKSSFTWNSANFIDAKSLADTVPVTGARDIEEQAMPDEREATYSPTSVGAAWTIQGSLVFGMMILYIVNWLDDDVRRYSWRVLSQTVCIFCAVMIEQTAEDQVFRLWGVWGNSEERTYSTLLAVTTLMVLFFFVLLQVATAYSSGLLGGLDEDELDVESWVVENGLRMTHEEIVPPDRIEFTKWGIGIALGEDDYPVFVKKRMLKRDQVNRRMNCWARLLTYCTAFAAVRMGFTIQHLPPFKHSWFLAGTVMLVQQLALSLIFRVLEMLTASLRNRSDSHVLVDMYEDHLWDSETVISALTMAALLAASIKFHISGVLADLEGRQPWQTIAASWDNAVALLCSGWTCLLIGLAISFLRGRGRAGHNDVQIGKSRHPLYVEEGGSGIITKTIDIVQSSLVITFAWCTTSAARWALLSMWRMGLVKVAPGSMLVQILVAVSTSLLAFGGTVLLDKMEDLEKWLLGEYASTDMLFRNSITSIGLVVGFAWEDTFETALDVAALSSSKDGAHAGLTKIILTSIVVILVIPAWRRYILAKELYYVELKTDKKTEDFLRIEDKEQELKSQEGGWFS